MSKNIKTLKENLGNEMYSMEYYLEKPYLADTYQEFMDQQTGSILKVGLPINLIKMSPQEFVDEFAKSIITMDAYEFTRILLVNQNALLVAFSEDDLVEMIEYYESRGGKENGRFMK